MSRSRLVLRPLPDTFPIEDLHPSVIVGGAPSLPDLVLIEGPGTSSIVLGRDPDTGITCAGVSRTQCRIRLRRDGGSASLHPRVVLDVFSDHVCVRRQTEGREFHHDTNRDDILALQNGDSVCLIGPFYEYVVRLEQYDGHIPNAVLIEDDADEYM